MATQEQIDAGRIASPEQVTALRKELITAFGSLSSFPEAYAEEMEVAEVEEAEESEESEVQTVLR